MGAVAQLGCDRERGAGLGAWYNDWYYNAKGVQSPDQKEASIQSCMDGYLAPGSARGPLSPEYARSQCEPLMTAVLKSRNADPSQDSLSNALAPINPFDPNSPPWPSWLKWTAIGFAGLIALPLILPRR